MIKCMLPLIGCCFVALFNEKPVLSILQSNQCELAFELLAIENKCQMTFGKPLAHGELAIFAGLRSSLLVSAFVPDHHCAGAIIASRNNSLKCTVLERM